MSKRLTGTQRAAFLIPDQGSAPTTPAFQRVGEFFSQRDVLSVGVELDWKAGPLTAAPTLAEAAITRHLTRFQPEEVLLFGLGVGAVVALTLAPRLEASAVLLASCAFLFEEDIQRLPFWMVPRVWPAYRGSEGRLRYPDEVPGMLVFFHGEREIVPVSIAAFRAERYPNAEQIIVEGVGANPDQPAYAAKIGAVVLGL